MSARRRIRAGCAALLAALALAAAAEPAAAERRVTPLPSYAAPIEIAEAVAVMSIDARLVTDGAPGAETLGVEAEADVTALVAAAETALARVWRDDPCEDRLTISNPSLTAAGATLALVADVDYRRFGCVDLLGIEQRAELARVRGRIAASVDVALTARGVRFDGRIDRAEFSYEVAETGGALGALLEAVSLSEADLDGIVVDLLESELDGALRDAEAELAAPPALHRLTLRRADIELFAPESGPAFARLAVETDFAADLLHAIVEAVSQ